MGIAVWSNTAFWAGLLLSRGAHSVRAGARLPGQLLLAAHLGTVALAMALLLFAPFEAALPIGALLAGAGLGPLYPLVLSISLPRFRSGPVFVMAGVGAALLPWVTGLLSTLFRSLRAGLLAPCAGVLILAISAVWMQREMPGHS